MLTCRDEPLVQRRVLCCAYQVATYLELSLVLWHVDAQVGHAKRQVQPVEDAIVLARGLEQREVSHRGDLCVSVCFVLLCCVFSTERLRATSPIGIART